MRPTETDLRAALDSPEALKPLLIAIAKWICEERDWELGEEAILETADYGLSKAAKVTEKCRSVFNFFTTCMSCFLRQIWRARHNAKLLSLAKEAIADLSK
jgi:hypothetical protein